MFALLYQGKQTRFEEATQNVTRTGYPYLLNSYPKIYININYVGDIIKKNVVSSHNLHRSKQETKKR